MEASVFDFLLNPSLLEELIPNTSEQDALSKLRSFLQLLQTEKSKNVTHVPPTPPVSAPPISIPGSPNDDHEISSIPSSPISVAPPTIFRKQSILQLMVLQLACKLDWNLTKLNQHLPIVLQHQLFDCLIAACQVQKILSELKVDNAEVILRGDMDERSVFALTLFCRWILRSVAGLPLPLPLGSKFNIFSALPKTTLPVVGNNDHGPLHQWISTQVDVALKVLQTLTDDKAKNLSRTPYVKSFCLVDNQVTCVADQGWISLPKNQWFATNLFTLTRYHLGLEEYGLAKNCLKSINDLGVKTFTEPKDASVFEGLKKSLTEEADKTLSPPPFQVSNNANDGPTILKLLDKKETPAYWRINYELSSSFLQLRQTAAIAEKNQICRMEISQPALTYHEVKKGKSSLMQEMPEKCKKKAKLLQALQDLIITEEKREKVEFTPTSLDSRTKWNRLKKRNTSMALLRENRLPKIQKLCNEAQKQQITPRTLSCRWLPNNHFFTSYLNSLPRGSDGEFLAVSICKVYQMCKSGALLEASKLFQSVETLDVERSRINKTPGLLKNVHLQVFSWNLENSLKNGNMVTEEIQNKCRQCIIDLTNFNPEMYADLLENCLAALVNKQDWDFIFSISESRWKLLQITQLVLSLAVFFKGNSMNLNMDPKKSCHLIFELLLHMHQPMGGINNPAKRMRDAGGSKSSPLLLLKFFDKVRHPDFLQVMASLYSTLYNDSVEDSSTRIFHDFPPIVLNTAQLPQGLGSDFYLLVLKQLVGQGSCLDSSWLRLNGEILFAQGNYPASLRCYIQSMVLNSSYFLKIMPGPNERDDKMVNKMIKCLVELHFHSYATVMSQFLSEVDYSISFKNLEERKSNDGMDGNYKNIWDVTVLEYAVSMHTKKGEHSRRREALRKIGSLEINTNNNVEILRETASFKKFSFLRILCQHFL